MVELVRRMRGMMAHASGPTPHTSSTMPVQTEDT
jgi:hypothetical protein